MRSPRERDHGALVVSREYEAAPGRPPLEQPAIGARRQLHFPDISARDDRVSLECTANAALRLGLG